MRTSNMLGLAAVAAMALSGCQSEGEARAGAADDAEMVHANPMITLHERQEPVFGLYVPRGEPVEAASEFMERGGQADYVFHSAMEGGVEEALPWWRPCGPPAPTPARTRSW